MKSGEADSGWVPVNIHRRGEGQKPRQGHLCDAEVGGGLRTPLPFPGDRGTGLPGLGSQSPSLCPTLLGLDRNLSVGTELSGEAGLTRREKGCYWHRSTARHPFGGVSGSDLQAPGGRRRGREAFPHLLHSEAIRSSRLRLGVFSYNFY